MNYERCETREKRSSSAGLVAGARFSTFPPPSIFRNAASSIVGAPFFSASVTFRSPGSAPTTRQSVFLLTEFVTVTPRERMASLAVYF
jgi:hypothetical protein